MTAIAVTYTFSNSTVADAAQVNTNFSDIVAGLSDATKTVTVAAVVSSTSTLGAATATTLNKLTFTTPATGSTLTIADGKTLTCSNTMTFTATDASTIAFSGGGNVLYDVLNQYNMAIGNASNVRKTINTNLSGDILAQYTTLTATGSNGSASLSCVSHGLVSGQVVYMSVASNGFAANTKYYVTFVTVDVFKVSTSLANLNAGTFVSGTGASTNTVIVGGINLSPAYMSATNATAMGFMAYAHGTNYNAGLAPTITLSAGGGTLSTVDHSAFIPYETVDGNWRLKFNIQVTLSVTSRTGYTLSINGVTFLSGPNQALSAWWGNQPTIFAYSVSNTATVQMGMSAASTGPTGQWSGDVALASKPTWAY